MNTSKEQCLKLIDKLANKTLSFGCMIQELNSGEYFCYKFLDWNWAYSSGNEIINILDDADGKTTQEDIDAELESSYKVLGHEVMLTTVLEKITGEITFTDEDYLNLLELWGMCGFTKSAQEIMEKSGFEEVEMCASNGKIRSNLIWPETRLKDPSARALFESLININ